MEYVMTKEMGEALLKKYGGAMDKSLNKWQKLCVIVNENFGIKGVCAKVKFAANSAD